MSSSYGGLGDRMKTQNEIEERKTTKTKCFRFGMRAPLTKYINPSIFFIRCGEEAEQFKIDHKGEILTIEEVEE